MSDSSNDGLLAMTVGIVGTYVAANRIDPGALPTLIQTVHGSLHDLNAPLEAGQAEQPERLTAAQIRKLVTPAGIISLITQKPFKSMKRHITTHGYTPESYRIHFGLPTDFPMVHPDYAAARSALAKSMGLGQGGRQKKKAAPVAKRARKPKA
ncbi:putative transcriptional regulator [Brevundimonas nasdae]|uniref:MucR family transcriptional regulator n=1 Tax=Brevundimonas nasdae TaxID=172043 RepID=UPI0019131AF8|nr:MucR family transcriptional regulator [Brevundimonas nasdae]MBK6025164.1 MucR family transcriptional regulator [Brevundimonas nasdae]MDQ0451500.1 putative transcriptional regulator [Brevundimonas nasdae]